MAKRTLPLLLIWARAKSSRFCIWARCLLGGSLTRGFASRLDAPFVGGNSRQLLDCLLGGSLTRGFSSRLDAPFLTLFDQVILARALRDWKRISRSLSHRDGAASRTFGPRAGDPQSKQMGGVND